MRVEPITPARRAHRRARATSRSRTARCCSARSATARRGSRTSAARPTPRRRSRRCARSGSRSTSTATTRCASSARACAGCRRRAGRSTARNAGTLVRLLAGILAGQDGQQFELTGDASLSARPMKRITEPLARMGAGVETDGRAPAAGRSRAGRCTAITYELPVASAQVKSAILLAGLYADGETTVVEPAPTRDHTELMLEAAGAPITRREHERHASGPRSGSSSARSRCPGDFSSAAPFIVAATLVPGSELHIHGVNLNPRRTGLLDDPRADGRPRHGLQPARDRRRAGGRPRGALGRARRDDRARRREVPLAIDELPLFALARLVRARRRAACAAPRSCARRRPTAIEATVDALRALGAARRRRPRTASGSAACRPGPAAAAIDSRGDHRIAMLGAVAGARLAGGRRDRGRRVRRRELPGLLRPARLARRRQAAA